MEGEGERGREVNKGETVGRNREREGERDIGRGRINTTVLDTTKSEDSGNLRRCPALMNNNEYF